MKNIKEKNKGTILITDSLFIFPEHEKKIREAGYEIERLDKVEASEDELIKAVKGKVGYILGGVEKITDKVIEAGSDLKVVSFTGSDWKWFIPGYKKAFENNIKITNALGANAFAVAEYSLVGILSMTRNIFDLSRCGDKKFIISKSINESVIGIIGMGKIGEQLARMLKGIGVKEIVYFSRSRNEELEKELEIRYVSLEEMFEVSDIISQHIPKSAGELVDKDILNKTKKGLIIINNGSTKCFNQDALYKKMKEEKIRVFQDKPEVNEKYKKLPVYVWQNSNASIAYNTHQANKLASDIATNSVLNILEGKDDKFIVSE